MKRFILIALTLVLTAGLTVQAQKRDKSLTITVTLPGGVPSTTATVALMHTDYALSYGNITLNAQGSAVVKVYAGKHRIDVSQPGYEDASTTVDVQSDTTVTVQLTEENTLPFSLLTTVLHNAHTGLNDVTLTWNQEPPVFYDDFESYEPFSITFGEWTGIDGDGLTTAPLVGDYINRGVMQYAQIINPLTVSPPWWYDYPILRPYSGQQYVGFIRTYSGAANDDWLISPTVTPGNKNVLAFMGKAADQYKEKFQVYITTKVDNPSRADFVMLGYNNYETADYRGWREYSYDLSQYAGVPVKFAIRYISETNNGGAFMLMVDDVYVGQDIPTSNQARKRLFRARRLGAAMRSPMNPNESFNVFLDGVQVGTTEDYEYTYHDLAAGTYELGVQAVYAASQTPVVTTTVTISNATARVTAHVTTNNGQSVDGCTVELTDVATTQTYLAMITDGQASFASVPFGTYLVGVTAEHYEVYDNQLDITGDCDINILLKETIVTPYNITADVDSMGNATLRWNQNLSFTDSFEDYPDFATGRFGDWRTYDLDGHYVYPIALGAMTNIVSFPGSGTASAPTAIAPMVFNPWKTVPPMLPTDPAVQAPTGDKTIIFFSPQQNGANKWLISPELTIREGFVCRFTAKAYADYVESMEVCVFPNGGNPASDTNVPVSSIDQLTAGVWTIYESDLAQYAGQTVRIGVHYTSFDAFFAQLDDFYVGNGEDEGSTIDVGYIDHYEVYLDGQLQGTATEPVFTFAHLSVGKHVAGVKAVYASGSSVMVEYTFEVIASALPGDVNGDGKVDIEDVNAAINIILELKDASDYTGTADLNGDNKVDVEDVNAIINIILSD